MRGTWGKRQRPQSVLQTLRALVRNSLFLLFLRGQSGLSGLGLGGALLELVHATGGIHEFLLTGVKRMAHVANTDDNCRLGGAGLDHVATSATDLRVHILRMNVCFHKRPKNLTQARRITSAKFVKMGLNRPEAGPSPGFLFPAPPAVISLLKC